MKIGQKFNKLNLKEYFFYIDNNKKYTNFNKLGLYRSIIENEKLSLAEKIEVRDYANKIFQKYFDFLQIKDPQTYFELITLGKEITSGDEQQLWREIRKNQEKVLKSKKIKHRNFGIFSKNSCARDDHMVKQRLTARRSYIDFESDKNRWESKSKSLRKKKERKNEQQIIQYLLENE